MRRAMADGRSRPSRSSPARTPRTSISGRRRSTSSMERTHGPAGRTTRRSVTPGTTERALTESGTVTCAVAALAEIATVTSSAAAVVTLLLTRRRAHHNLGASAARSLLPREIPMRIPLSVLSLLSAVGLMMAVPAVIHAQLTITLEGSVRNNAGEPVVGAVVAVVNPATNERRGVNTNDLGRFRVLGLGPGRYEVTVRGIGFQQESQMVELLLEIGRAHV